MDGAMKMTGTKKDHPHQELWPREMQREEQRVPFILSCNLYSRPDQSIINNTICSKNKLTLLMFSVTFVTLLLRWLKGFDGNLSCVFYHYLSHNCTEGEINLPS